MEEFAGALIAAADADVAEHGQRFTLLAAARRPTGRTGPVRLLLTAPDPSALSGAVVALALAVAAVLAGRVPPGPAHAADVLDPQVCLTALRADPAVSMLQID